MKYGIWMILLMVGLVGAVDLDTVLMGNTVFGGPNCRAEGGATFYDVGVAIKNPSSATSLRVTYLYYNASSGAYEDGGKACDVKPNMRETCYFRIYSITGGVNKSENVSFKIIGSDEVKQYNAQLEVTVNHYVGGYEQNIIDKLAVARSEYDRVFKKYKECYNTSASAIFETANYKIGDAEKKLSACNITGALNATTDAINKIHQIEDGIKPENCANQSQVNNTPPQPPPITPPENQTLPNVTTNETPQPPSGNLTNITTALAKGCMPFAILLVLLFTAVWSDRKFSA